MDSWKTLAIAVMVLSSTQATAAENNKNALRVDVDFWLENAETLEQKFNAWASK